MISEVIWIKDIKICFMEKEIKMEGTPKKEQKLSYEKLNEVCSQLYQENQYMKRQLYEANEALASRRMDYLFRIVEAKDTFSPEFVASCVSEIEGAFTPQQENQEGE